MSTQAGDSLLSIVIPAWATSVPCGKASGEKGSSQRIEEGVGWGGVRVQGEAGEA